MVMINKPLEKLEPSASGKFCCNNMEVSVLDDKIIYYDSLIRSYYITIPTSKMSCKDLLHCPWCGMKLPSVLAREYCDILEDEYGLNPFDKSISIPQEFQSSEWWQKRGL